MKNIPKTKEALQTIPKGIAMGIADVIPGVSGGTLALLLGIYERLIHALRGLDLKLVAELAAALHPRRNTKLKAVLQKYDCLFLGFLLLGMASAIAIASKVIPQLMIDHTPETLGLFMGLIIPSISVPFGAIGASDERTDSKLSLLVAGAAGTALAISCSLIMQSHGTLLGTQFGFGTSALVVLLSAMIAICAMILPGISGSYLLLLLGQYFFVLGIVGRLLNDILGRQPGKHADALILVERFNTLEVFGLACCFGLGAVIGLVCFSRVINWALNRFHNISMAALTGMVLGSLYVLWPFKVMPEATTLEALHIAVDEKVKWLPMAGNYLPATDELLTPGIALLVGATLSWGLIRWGRSATND